VQTLLTARIVCMLDRINMSSSQTGAQWWVVLVTQYIWILWVTSILLEVFRIQSYIIYHFLLI